MEVTMQGILRHAFQEYAEARRLPLHIHKAVRALSDCRTSALGGHIQKCPEGHVEGVWYNSCKHRSCPRCAGLATERWLGLQKSRLLSCDHYHVIFTIPHEFVALWKRNPRVMGNCLLESSAATLRELLADPRYLGALPGMIGALHTWGRSLVLHPHAHFLVTGGGLADNGQWKSVGNGFLLPSRVVRALFRGKFIASVRSRMRKGELKLPRGLSGRKPENLLNRLGRKTWNVRICERYAHGRGVMSYLSRYVKGGPLKNSQLVGYDGKVVHFRYRDHRAGEPREMILTREAFLHRWLWHVPDRGMHTVRYYGLYAHGKSQQRAQCREQLGQGPEEKPEFLEWQDYMAGKGSGNAGCCRTCGRRLVHGRRIGRSRSPPVTV